MAAITAIVERILVILVNLLGVISGMNSVLGSTAQESQKLIIQTIAANAANTVNSPTFGNAALLAAIADAKAQGIADTASLLVAISDLTDGTTPVSLPVSPPTGYGASSLSDIADAVWSYSIFPLGGGARYYLAAAGNYGGYQKFQLFEGADNTYFYPLMPDVFWPFGVSADYPRFDPSDILVSETLLTCMARQNPAFSCAWWTYTDGAVKLTGPGGSDVEDWITTLDETRFQFIKSLIFPINSIEIAPNWPGLAKVTLGTPVAITPGLTITTPMDGVIVTITSVTANKPSLAYGSELAYKFIGGLSFVSDNGQVEPFQQLAFTNALYCPREMTRAASVVLRADASVVGTVTPWVIA